MPPPSVTLRCTSLSWSGIGSDTGTQEKYQASTEQENACFSSAVMEGLGADFRCGLLELSPALHLLVSVSL